MHSENERQLRFRKCVNSHYPNFQPHIEVQILGLDNSRLMDRVVRDICSTSLTRISPCLIAIPEFQHPLAVQESISADGKAFHFWLSGDSNGTVHAREASSPILCSGDSSEDCCQI